MHIPAVLILSSPWHAGSAAVLTRAQPHTNLNNRAHAWAMQAESVMLASMQLLAVVLLCHPRCHLYWLGRSREQITLWGSHPANYCPLGANYCPLGAVLMAGGRDRAC